MTRLRVGVIFGGMSVEHEVSVITAQQVMAILAESHDVVPLYIAKAGTWYTGSHLASLDAFADVDAAMARADAVTPLVNAAAPGSLRGLGPHGPFSRRGGNRYAIDVAFPLIHGTFGEDGTLAGLLEMWNVPYVGCGVAAAALSMDKPLAKRVLRAEGIPVLDDVVVERVEWQAARAEVVARIVQRVGIPAFVKPATLGSSIGVAPAENPDELADAIDVAMAYAERAIIEPLQRPMIEVNCAVLSGSGTLRASVCEQPISSGVLTYEEKYAPGSGGKQAGGGSVVTLGAKQTGESPGAKGGSKSGGKNGGMSSTQRIIPAPIGDELTERIQGLAIAACRAIGAEGVARVDFIFRPDSGDVVLNEINTIPGSLAFYLWEPAGLSFPALVEELLAQALATQSRRQASAHSIDSWLLARATGGGRG